MAEVLVKKPVVVEDPKALRQYMNAEPITNEWWYRYKCIAPSESDTVIEIPSDNLVRLWASVYNSILSGELIVKNGSLEKCPKCFRGEGDTKGEPTAYVKEYLEKNYNKYLEVIDDARNITTMLMQFSTGVKSSSWRKFADKFFLKFGFIKVYSMLKLEEENIKKNFKTKSVKVDLDALATDAEAKKVFDEIFASILDAAEFDGENFVINEIKAKELQEILNDTVAKYDISPMSASSTSISTNTQPPTTTVAAAVVAPTKPLPKAPVDSETSKLQKAFVTDEAGNVEIKLFNMLSEPEAPTVNVVPPVITVQAQQPTETVMQPQPASAPSSAVPETKVKKDKKDLKEASTKFEMPVGGITIRNKDEYISHNPSLTVIENKLDHDQFNSVYRTDGNFTYVDIYGNGDPETKIDWMSMTVDLSGRVCGPSPKFWPGSDNKEPVDFMPALHLTEEAVSAYWNKEQDVDIPLKFYYVTKETAELNRKVDINSIFDNVKEQSEIPVVIKTITEAMKSNKLKNKIKDSRLKMTSYTSSSEFTLAPTEDVLVYVGGDKANKDVVPFTVTVKGKSVTVS